MRSLGKLSLKMTRFGDIIPSAVIHQSYILKIIKIGEIIFKTLNYFKFQFIKIKLFIQLKMKKHIKSQDTIITDMANRSTIFRTKEDYFPDDATKLHIHK